MLKERILEKLNTSGHMTVEEMAQALNAPASSIRRRCGELWQKGKIRQISAAAGKVTVWGATNEKSAESTAENA